MGAWTDIQFSRGIVIRFERRSGALNPASGLNVGRASPRLRPTSADSDLSCPRSVFQLLSRTCLGIENAPEAEG